ncbi:MAG: S-layer homology domain-containing protein [Firmicutes bacterium]|nr:S-layer homology domain-containing protein [Bacillota bacterium]
MKIKHTKRTKQLITTALSLILLIGLLPFSAFAADSDANIESNLSDFFSTTQKGDVPNQFNTAGDPYGESGYFNIAPQHELLKIFIGGERTTGSTNNDMYITKNTKLGVTDIDDYHNAADLVNSMDGVLNKWSYIQAVAFDPAGSGRDTHLAYIGYDASAKAIKLGVYDLVNQNAASNTRWVADAAWIAEADGHTLMHFNAFNFMSITAGDYNGDGKETLVVFASADGTATTLTEYYFSADSKRIYEQSKSNGLLHYDYIATGLGNTTKAYEKLAADLVTGDFDHDGIDDMAVVSYQGMIRKADCTASKEELLMPYLSVAMGCGNGEHIVSKTTNNREKYIYEKIAYELSEGGYAYRVLNGASVAAGDVDGDGMDELMLTGQWMNIVCDNQKWHYDSQFVDTPLYGYDISVKASSTELNLFTDARLKGIDSGSTTGGDAYINAWTYDSQRKYISYNDNDDISMSLALPQLAVECVKTNGENAAEDIFLNGTFYTYSVQNSEWVYEYEDGYFSDIVGIFDPDDEGDLEWEHQIGYMTNVSAGVFDGNLVGREQIAYTVWLKDGQSNSLVGTTDNADDYTAMLGISGGVTYNDTTADGEVVTYGAVTNYSSSGLKDRANGYENKTAHEFFNTRMDYTDAKNLLFVAVDVDHDGVLAQYAGKDYTYSDPSVITVLQAAPYYKDFGYLDDCATSYEVTTSFIVGQSESNSSSFSVGMNVEAQAFCIKTSISTGYTQGWEESFTEEFETGYSTTFTATRDNVVVMQRTPVILYKYLVQNSEGEWSEASDANGNYFTVAVPCEPVYALVSVDEYNEFVKEGSPYHNAMRNSSHMLKPITSDMLLDNEGDPADYRDHWNGATNLSAATYEASSGSGHITSSYSTGSSSTLEQKTTVGFYFDSTVSVGFESPFGVSAWSGVEMAKEGTRTQGSYTTTANSTTVSGTVANLGESGLPAEMLQNYVFKWEFGCWQLDMGINPVYVYGYRVLNARDGITLVENLKVNDGTGSAESAVLTWDAVDGATGYTVYTYEDGEYTPIGTTPESETTYTHVIPSDTRQFEYVFAVTATMAGGDSIYSKLVKYYRQSYGMSAYEIAVENGFEGTVEEWLESLVGADGNDGIGVKGFSYNNDGELIATLTDGTIINLGVIHGEDGKNGLTPYIDENGNWWIGEVDTGVKAIGADGKDGITPQLRINIETNEWEVSLDNGETWSSTGVKATGAKGDKGDKGDPGIGIESAVLDQDGNLIITLTDHSVHNLGKIVGTDGRGIANIEIDAYGNFIFTMSDGTTIKAQWKNNPFLSSPFTDVNEKDYYYDPVVWAVQNGITAGTSATTFSPDLGCTRGQAVTFLWRAAGEPEPQNNEMPFTDVETDQYYYKAVQWAIENGITEGTSATTFHPYQTCTRSQIVSFLWRTADEPDPVNNEMPFTDVEADQYYCKAVQWAIENGITEGTSATTFSPELTCTRGQIVTFLYRDMAN